MKELFERTRRLLDNFKAEFEPNCTENDENFLASIAGRFRAEKEKIDSLKRSLDNFLQFFSSDEENRISSFDRLTKKISAESSYDKAIGAAIERRKKLFRLAQNFDEFLKTKNLQTNFSGDFEIFFDSLRHKIQTLLDEKNKILNDEKNRRETKFWRNVFPTKFYKFFFAAAPPPRNDSNKTKSTFNNKSNGFNRKRNARSNKFLWIPNEFNAKKTNKSKFEPIHQTPQDWAEHKSHPHSSTFSQTSFSRSKNDRVRACRIQRYNLSKLRESCHVSLSSQYSVNVYSIIQPTATYVVNTDTSRLFTHRCGPWNCIHSHNPFTVSFSWPDQIIRPFEWCILRTGRVRRKHWCICKLSVHSSWFMVRKKESWIPSSYMYMTAVHVLLYSTIL